MYSNYIYYLLIYSLIDEEKEENDLARMRGMMRTGPNNFNLNEYHTHSEVTGLIVAPSELCFHCVT